MSSAFDVVEPHAVLVAGDPVDVRATMRSYEYGGEWIAVSVPALRGSGVNIIFVPARIVRGVKIERSHG